LKEQKDLNYKIFLKNDTIIIDSDGERKERDLKNMSHKKLESKRQSINKYIT